MLKTQQMIKDAHQTQQAVNPIKYTIYEQNHSIKDSGSFSKKSTVTKTHTNIK